MSNQPEFRGLQHSGKALQTYANTGIKTKRNRPMNAFNTRLKQSHDIEILQYQNAFTDLINEQVQSSGK